MQLDAKCSSSLDPKLYPGLRPGKKLNSLSEPFSLRCTVYQVTSMQRLLRTLETGKRSCK